MGMTGLPPAAVTKTWDWLEEAETEFEGPSFDMEERFAKSKILDRDVSDSDVPTTV